MATITIDKIEYDLDTLSAEAAQQVTNLNVCDQEIARLGTQLAIAQTARAAYGRELLALLPAADAAPAKKKKK